MAPIRVVDITDDAGGRDVFHALVAPLYQHEPAGTAPQRTTVERNLTRDTFAGSQRLFVAFDGDRAVARIGARLSPTLRDERGLPFGMLGFFEAQPRADAAHAMFAAATAWLRARGAGRIVGPMDGDTWHRYRVNAGPFIRPPFPLEPWNPPYYRELWEGAGFTPVESYSSKWIGDVATLLPGLREGAARSASRGVRIRGLDRDRIPEELAIVHAISSEIFHDAFLYSPIGRDDFLDMYGGVERLLDPELVVFAESPDGQAVGFVFAYADPREPAVHYKTIGVKADWRRSAVAAALSAHVYGNALKKGLPGGNHALMRDDNRSQALDQGFGDVFRRYLLYEWSGA